MSPRHPIPAARHRAELVIERSRFICTLAPAATVAEAQALIRAVGAEFPDATHHCWAYLVGAPGSTDRIGLSDDGEPHGTAGRPMLTVLQHSGVGEIAAVVTRYYGGTKLGTGGLVKAYGGAVAHALETLPRIEKRAWVSLRVTVDYAAVGAVRQLWPRCEAEVLDEAYAADVVVTVRVPEERVDEVRRAIADATGGRGGVERVGN